MRISLELVPRDFTILETELELVRRNIPGIDTFNIPDLLRFPVRSWEGAFFAKKFCGNVIPHIRASDFDMNKPFPLINAFTGNGIDEVLIIRGDHETGGVYYPNNTADFIRKIKSEMPFSKIYAAIDPYRHELKREMDYMEKKMEAGVEGFFSQPFFDLRLMEIYAEKLSEYSVFWGISPVTNSKTRAYWETRNRVHFPENFEPSMEWNVEFAKKALDYCRSNNFNLYLMPIRVDLEEYLNGIFQYENAAAY
jgi:methylenetetrahydrofolate reductase (NADPH)